MLSRYKVFHNFIESINVFLVQVFQSSSKWVQDTQLSKRLNIQQVRSRCKAFLSCKYIVSAKVSSHSVLGLKVLKRFKI